MFCFASIFLSAGDTTNQAVPFDNEGQWDMALLHTLAVLSLPIWAYVLVQASRRRSPLRYEDHPAVPWKGLDAIVVVLSSITVMLLLPGLLLVLKQVELTSDGKLPDAANGLFIAASSLAQVCALLLAIYLLMTRTGASWEEMGLDLSHWRRDIPLGLAAFLLIVPPVLYLHLGLLAYWNKLHPIFEEVKNNREILPIVGFRAVLVAPLFEEFFFRVLLQGWLEARESAAPRPQRIAWLPAGSTPILISSTIFALFHAGQGPAPVPIFFLAIMLGYLYHQTHRILPSLIVHTLLNAITFASLWWRTYHGG